MNSQIALTRLISDYQNSVHAAVVLMQRSGIPMPFSSADWIETDIPQYGELEGGIRYFKHGFGCEVSLATGTVDFDFGERGEIGGFDAWRLTHFAGSRLVEYGFDTEVTLRSCFADAVAAGVLVDSGHIQYYLANVHRMLAIDVDSRLPGDSLPLQAQDRVLALYAHCFLAADLMRKNYENLNRKWDNRGYLGRNERINLGIYLSSWLGYLRATCEGFEKLRMRLLLQEDRPKEFCELVEKFDELRGIIKRHSDSLRKLRNNVFHLRDDVSAIRGFFAKEEDRLPWARELHTAIAKFFSDYRVLCEVHYAIHGRKSEMIAVHERSKRRK